MAFNNYVTAARARVKARKDVSVEEMVRLVELASTWMDKAVSYRAKANIGGVVVELATNSRHQYEFWTDNWWAPPDGTRPHAWVYSVHGVPNMEPSAYYSPPLNTSVFINTEYYGQSP